MLDRPPDSSIVLTATKVGGFVLVEGESDRGYEWLEQFVGPDRTWIGDSLAIGARYAPGFINLARQEGFRWRHDAIDHPAQS